MSDTDVIESAYGPLLGEHPSELPAHTMVSALGSIISVPGFLSAAECAKLIDVSEKTGYDKLAWNPVRMAPNGGVGWSKRAFCECE